MSRPVSFASTVRSEWIKFRSVRSSVLGIAIMFALTVGLAILIAAALRSHWDSVNPAERLAFDPVRESLGGVLFAQFAVGVIGALFITSEYTTNSIRTTLAAVPRRLTLLAGKLTVLTVTVLVVSEAACLSSFAIAQAIFAPRVPSASLGDPGVLRTVLLAGLYLTLLGVLGFALGMILRQSAATISVFVSALLVIPLIVIFLPSSWQNAIQRWEPSELGRAMVSPVSIPGDLSQWRATATLLAYVAVVTVIGATLVARRDA